MKGPETIICDTLILMRFITELFVICKIKTPSVGNVKSSQKHYFIRGLC
jgi:hypothetical protein